MRSIAMADQKADAPPHEALMGTAQNTQYVLPIAMQPDVRTGLLESATGAPILKIDPSSTLFTDALGYTTSDMAEQNPFTHIVTSSSEDVSGEPATSKTQEIFCLCATEWPQTFDSFWRQALRSIPRQVGTLQ